MLIGAKTISEFSDRQRQTYELIASGPRKDVPYPFLAMLDAPSLANAIQSVGADLRFSGVLSDEMRELAILSVAGAIGSGYEWDYHVAIARKLSIPEEDIAATRSGISEGKALSGRTHELIVRLCRQTVHQRQVPLTILSEIVDTLGRQAATELVAICGYYPLLALFLSAGELDHSLPAST